MNKLAVIFVAALWLAFGSVAVAESPFVATCSGGDSYQIFKGVVMNSQPEWEKRDCGIVSGSAGTAMFYALRDAGRQTIPLGDESFVASDPDAAAKVLDAIAAKGYMKTDEEDLTFQYCARGCPQRFSGLVFVRYYVGPSGENLAFGISVIPDGTVFHVFERYK